MVSIKTGKVVEFYDEDIEKRQKLVAKKYKFKIQDHSLVLYGELKMNSFSFRQYFVCIF
ncbi:MAG: hypothetical protein CM15mP93_12030 [Thiotrichaceae bacterium]|nr:MAG: hypothetical protein CM15mP93_12030 [Thiotrichaceae bacterium]